MKEAIGTGARSKTVELMGVRIRAVGRRTKLPADLQELLAGLESATKNNKDLNVQIDLAYGGHDEIVDATNAVLAVGEKLSPESLQRNTYLAAVGLPSVDAVLRTSGERRLNVFMLWDSQYTEFATTDELWPDLRESTFLSPSPRSLQPRPTRGVHEEERKDHFTGRSLMPCANLHHPKDVVSFAPISFALNI